MANQFVFANNVNTTLANPASSGATTLTLSSSTNLPTLAAGQIWKMTLNDVATQTVFEIVHVTAISGASLTVTRGQEGTTAQSWLVGDYAFGAVTAAELTAMLQVDLTNTLSGTGNVTLGPLLLQWGTVTNVAADGSASSSITFPIRFPTACFGVNPSILNAFQTHAWQLSIQWDSPTVTGSNVNVAGAPAGSTVSVFYTAIGH